jgi:alanine racemase
MTLRLTVRRDDWLQHVRNTVAALGDVVPVVKGNGYGFSRPVLVQHAVSMSRQIAVGSVFELQDVPSSHDVIVLTPIVTAHSPIPDHALLTVGSPAHVDALVASGFRGRVLIKLRSSMMRFGATRNDVPALVDKVRQAGLRHEGWSIHPPLPQERLDHAAEVGSAISHLPDSLPIYVSHLTAHSLAQLRSAHVGRKIVMRSGTDLWLGDKSMVSLSADVLDVHENVSGSAGYRLNPLPEDAAIVVIGAGSAHGVSLLANEQSPFHFERRRLTLLEPPHMHASMVVVPPGESVPQVGSFVDVQQPMTRVMVDSIDWV